MSAAWPYPAPEDDDGAAHLHAGLALPDIALPATEEPQATPPGQQSAPVASGHPPPARGEGGMRGSLVPSPRRGEGQGEGAQTSRLGRDAISLARLAGAAIVFVYPWTGRPGLPNPPGWDDIPGAHGSTPEAQGFRDHHADYKGLGFDVLGVSGQSPADQREFATRMALPFPLLSDADGRLRAALALPTFETGGVTYLKRLTLVLRDGRIERTVYPVHPPDTHARDLLAGLTA